MEKNLEKIREKTLVALKIRNEIQNIMKTHNVKTQLCLENVNPYYNQTDENADGFICEYYYGYPSKIYTPLGYIDITSGYLVGDENADNAAREIEEKFGFVLKQARVQSKMGVFGEWYYITKLPWDNTTFNCDCSERVRDEYIEYKTAKELFGELAS